jgi:hypothetical protein
VPEPPPKPKRYATELVDGAIANALRWVARGVQFPTGDMVLAAEVIALREQLTEAQKLVVRWRAMATAQRLCALRWRESGGVFDAHAQRCDNHADILETQATILAWVVKGPGGEGPPKTDLVGW